MKKRLIVKYFALLLLMFFYACKSEKKKEHHDIGKVEVDSALMALINPTDEKVVSRAVTVKPVEKAGATMVEMQGVVNFDTKNERYIASRVSGRVERLYIKYNYQPVKKGQLVMEVYAPALASAQQDLLYLAKSGEDVTLLQKAKQRLRLLGMSKAAVDEVLSSGEVNYRVPVYSNVDGFVVEASASAAVAPTLDAPVSAGGMAGMGMADVESPQASATASPSANQAVALVEGAYVNAGQSLFKVYQKSGLIGEFAIHPSMLAFVKPGTELAFYNPSRREKTFSTAKIDLVQPYLTKGSSFSVAKVKLSATQFRVGEVLLAKIPLVLPKSTWLPVSAVTKRGADFVVFRKEQGVFKPQVVDLGMRLGHQIQVLTAIKNWEVAKDAAYMIDSESFIQVK